MSHPVNARITVERRGDDSSTPWGGGTPDYVAAPFTVEAWLTLQSARELPVGVETGVSDWFVSIPGYEVDRLEAAGFPVDELGRVLEGGHTYAVEGRPLRATLDLGGRVHHLEANLRLVS